MSLFVRATEKKKRIEKARFRVILSDEFKGSSNSSNRKEFIRVSRKLTNTSIDVLTKVLCLVVEEKNRKYRKYD